MTGCCEECTHYEYDPEEDAYYCRADLDQDDMERLLRNGAAACPYYRWDRGQER